MLAGRSNVQGSQPLSRAVVPLRDAFASGDTKNSDTWVRIKSRRSDERAPCAEDIGFHLTGRCPAVERRLVLQARQSRDLGGSHEGEWPEKEVARLLQTFRRFWRYREEGLERRAQVRSHRRQVVNPLSHLWTVRPEASYSVSLCSK